MMGLFTRKKNPKDELSNMLNGYEIPSFSKVVMNVLQLLRDPDSSMAAIAKEINYDPALVLSVFQMVNSAAFGLRKRCDDIKQAVTLLGRGRLEAIVLTQAVKTAQPESNVAWFDNKVFWQTSAKRATLARNFASKLHPASATQAFTAGMLQDMGIPVLVATMKKKYEKVITTSINDKTAMIDVEKEMLNFDHQLVGELMATEWNLPESLIGSISKHHDIGVVEPAVGLVSLLRDGDVDGSRERLMNTSNERFNLDADEIDKMIETAYDEAASINLA